MTRRCIPFHSTFRFDLRGFSSFWGWVGFIAIWIHLAQHRIGIGSLGPDTEARRRAIELAFLGWGVGLVKKK
ncbi:hypothetical protein DL95DRAFT_379203 [Leptodontidium sp. 2 PMI_412]|nr:hypothetical protein DL95DRAFT_379203 [Leptodontidium sp. 2 PMI_412]